MYSVMEMDQCSVISAWEGQCKSRGVSLDKRMEDTLLHCTFVCTLGLSHIPHMCAHTARLDVVGSHKYPFVHPTHKGQP